MNFIHVKISKNQSDGVTKLDEVLTKSSRYDADTVGEHGSLDHIEIWQHGKHQQCQPGRVTSLRKHHYEEVKAWGAAPRLEEADTHGADQRANLDTRKTC